MSTTEIGGHVQSPPRRVVLQSAVFSAMLALTFLAGCGGSTPSMHEEWLSEPRVLADMPLTIRMVPNRRVNFKRRLLPPAAESSDGSDSPWAEIIVEIPRASSMVLCVASGDHILMLQTRTEAGLFRGNWDTPDNERANVACVFWDGQRNTQQRTAYVRVEGDPIFGERDAGRAVPFSLAIETGPANLSPESVEEASMLLIGELVSPIISDCESLVSDATEGRPLDPDDERGGACVLHLVYAATEARTRQDFLNSELTPGDLSQALCGETLIRSFCTAYLNMLHYPIARLLQEHEASRDVNMALRACRDGIGVGCLYAEVGVGLDGATREEQLLAAQQVRDALTANCRRAPDDSEDRQWNCAAAAAYHASFWLYMWPAGLLDYIDIVPKAATLLREEPDRLVAVELLRIGCANNELDSCVLLEAASARGREPDMVVRSILRVAGYCDANPMVDNKQACGRAVALFVLAALDKAEAHPPRQQQRIIAEACGIPSGRAMEYGCPQLRTEMEEAVRREARARAEESVAGEAQHQPDNESSESEGEDEDEPAE